MTIASLVARRHRRTKDVPRILVLLPLAILLQPRALEACSCLPSPEPRVAMLKADMVFAGEVVDVGPPDGYTAAFRFRVSRIWKGGRAAEVTVETARGGASCGYRFASGEQYLVYAYSHEGRLSTGLCTRTGPLAISEDPEALPYSIHPFAGLEEATAEVSADEPELDAIPASLLEGRLRSTDPRLRLQAIWALPERPEMVEIAVGSLSDLLAKAPDLDRRHLLAALAKLPAGRAKSLLPTLIETLADASAEIRQQAIDALAAIGPTAATAAGALTALVADDTLRQSLLATLDRTPGSDPALTHLRGEFEIANSLPTEAAKALGVIGTGTPDTGDAILSGLQARRLEPDAAAALPALGLRVEEALDHFRAELRAPIPWRRVVAARTLAALGPAADEAIADLVTLLDDSKREVRAEAARTLAAIGAPELPRLVGLLATADPGGGVGLADAFEIYAKRGIDVIGPLVEAILADQVTDPTLLLGHSYSEELRARLEAAGMASALDHDFERESWLERLIDRVRRELPREALPLLLVLILAVFWLALQLWPTTQRDGTLRQALHKVLPILIIGVSLATVVAQGGPTLVDQIRRFASRSQPPAQPSAQHIRQGDGYRAILNPGTGTLTSVVTGGGRILVGYRESMAEDNAYLFDADGELLLTLEDPTPASRDDFGTVIAIAGDTLLAAGPNNGDLAAGAGAALLFDAESGELRQRVDPPRIRADANFGTRLAAAGDELFAVAAPSDGWQAENGGTIHLYHHGGDHMRSIGNPEPELCRRFGGGGLHFLPARGVAVGTPFCEGYGVDGLVFVFDPGSGEEILRLENPRPGEIDLFGETLAAGGDYILVGAPQDETAGSSEGAVYLFDATTGTLLHALPNPEPTTEGNNQFGSSLVFLGKERFAVGSPGGDAVYLYATSSGELLKTIRWPRILVRDRAFPGGFGSQMAVWDRSLFVLAQREAGFLGGPQGVLYVFSWDA